MRKLGKKSLFTTIITTAMLVAGLFSLPNQQNSINYNDINYNIASKEYEERAYGFASKKENSLNSEKSLHYWIPFASTSKVWTYNNNLTYNYAPYYLTWNISSDGRLLLGVYTPNLWDLTPENKPNMKPSKSTTGWMTPISLTYRWKKKDDDSAWDSNTKRNIVDLSYDLKSDSSTTPLVYNYRNGTGDDYNSGLDEKTYNELWDHYFDSDFELDSNWNGEYRNSFILSLPILEDTEWNNSSQSNQGINIHNKNSLGMTGTDGPAVTLISDVDGGISYAVANTGFYEYRSVSLAPLPLNDDDININDRYYHTKSSGPSAAYEMNFLPYILIAPKTTTNNLMFAFNIIDSFPGEKYFNFYSASIDIAEGEDYDEANSILPNGKPYYLFDSPTPIQDLNSLPTKGKYELNIGNLEETNKTVTPGLEDVVVKPDTSYSYKVELKWNYSDIGLSEFGIDPVNNDVEILSTPDIQKIDTKSISSKAPWNIKWDFVGQTKVEGNTRQMTQDIKLSFEQYNTEEALADEDWFRTNIQAIKIVDANNHSVCYDTSFGDSLIGTDEPSINDYMLIWDEDPSKSEKMKAGETMNIALEITYGTTATHKMYTSPKSIDIPKRGPKSYNFYVQPTWTLTDSKAANSSISVDADFKLYWKVPSGFVGSDFEGAKDITDYGIKGTVVDENGNTSPFTFEKKLDTPIDTSKVESKENITLTINDPNAFKPNKTYKNLQLGLSTDDIWTWSDKSTGEVTTPSLGPGTGKVSDVKLAEEPKSTSAEIGLNAELAIDNDYENDKLAYELVKSESTSSHATGIEDITSGTNGSVVYGDQKITVNGLHPREDYHLVYRFYSTLSSGYDEKFSVDFKTDYASKDQVTIETPVVENITNDSADVTFNAELSHNIVNKPDEATYKLVNYNDESIIYDEGNVVEGKNVIHLTNLKKNDTTKMKLTIDSVNQGTIGNADITKTVNVVTSSLGAFKPIVTNLTLDSSTINGDKINREISFDLETSLAKNDHDGYDASGITAIKLMKSEDEGSTYAKQIATISPSTIKDINSTQKFVINDLPSKVDDYYQLQIVYRDGVVEENISAPGMTLGTDSSVISSTGKLEVNSEGKVDVENATLDLSVDLNPNSNSYDQSSGITILLDSSIPEELDGLSLEVNGATRGISTTINASGDYKVKIKGLKGNKSYNGLKLKWTQNDQISSGTSPEGAITLSSFSTESLGKDIADVTVKEGNDIQGNGDDSDADDIISSAEFTFVNNINPKGFEYLEDANVKAEITTAGITFDDGATTKALDGGENTVKLINLPINQTTPIEFKLSSDNGLDKTITVNVSTKSKGFDNQVEVKQEGDISFKGDSKNSIESDYIEVKINSNLNLSGEEYKISTLDLALKGNDANGLTLDKTSIGNGQTTIKISGLQEETKYSDVSIVWTLHDDPAVTGEINLGEFQTITFKNFLWLIIFIVIIIILLLLVLLLLLAYLLLWIIKSGKTEVKGNDVIITINKKYDSIKDKVNNAKLYINDKEFSYQLVAGTKGEALIQVKGAKSEGEVLSNIKFTTSEDKNIKLIGKAKVK